MTKDKMRDLRKQIHQARLDDIKRRSEAAAKWDKQIRDMGISRAEFCRLARENTSQLSRLLNGVNVPMWPLIKRINAKIERVKKSLNRKKDQA